MTTKANFRKTMNEARMPASAAVTTPLIVVEGRILFCYGTGATPTAGTNYAHGCIYIRTDGTGTNDALYVNTAANDATATFTLLNIN